jgi:hypothetical protein
VRNDFEMFIPDARVISAKMVTLRAFGHRSVKDFVENAMS